MGDFEAAEIAVVQIRMRIEMDHADRPLGPQCAQDGVGDQMITAAGKRQHIHGDQAGIVSLKLGHGIHEISRVHVRIPKIGHIGQFIRRDAQGRIGAAHHLRHLAHLPGAMAGTGAVGGAAIKGHANNADIDIGGIFGCHMRQAHESGDTGKARNSHARNGLMEGFRVGHSFFLFAVWALNP